MNSYLRESGVPLGGLGTGRVDLCPDGAFRNVSIQNNIDWPYSGNADQSDPIKGSKTYDWSPVGLEEAFFAASVEGAGARMLKVDEKLPLPGLPLEDIQYEGRYPFVRLGVPAMNDVALAVHGFSPMLLDDASPQYRDSSLPTAIFTMEAVNTGTEPRRVGLAFSFPHIVGMGGFTHCRINDRRGNITRESSTAERAMIHFGHRKPKISQRVEGEIALAAFAQDGVTLKSTNGWWREEMFEDFGKDQLLPQPRGEAVVLTDAGAIHQGSMGAVGATKVLAPGERWQQRFCLAWYFPMRPCNDGPKVYRNMYATHFSNVDAVMDYVQEHHPRLEKETRQWHEALDASNLPSWWIDKLCNNLSHFSTGSVYCDDGRGSFNESPVIMNGCMGTLDQRLASHGPCTFAFPDMARSELDMFIGTQVLEDDPQRFAPHWNQESGTFDAEIDRAGAVKHNIGRDDFEGGFTDHTKWLTTHWPDRFPAFVLELYIQAAWTGDRDYLEEVYPRMLAAFEFQQRLDQNCDGIGDVWGHGCCTYDSRRYQLCGASSYVGSLYLAGLRCLQKTARLLGDEARIPILQEAFDRAQQTMETHLWNEEEGQYDKWYDPWHANWKDSHNPHGERSTARMTAQVAGAWFVPLLDLEPILKPERIERALDGLYEHNLLPFAGCMCNETGNDERANRQSWPYYAEVFYAAPSIIAGKSEQGMELEKRFAHSMQASGRHWDLPLMWQGEQMDEPGWGRWYMTTPASWFVLQALHGVTYDGITHSLSVRPRPWKEIGELEELPIFHPLFWGSISSDEQGWTLSISKLRKGPLPLSELLVDGELQLSCDGSPIPLEGKPGRYALEWSIEQEGIRLRGTHSGSQAAASVFDRV